MSASRWSHSFANHWAPCIRCSIWCSIGHIWCSLFDLVQIISSLYTMSSVSSDAAPNTSALYLTLPYFETSLQVVYGEVFGVPPDTSGAYYIPKSFLVSASHILSLQATSSMPSGTPSICLMFSRLLQVVSSSFLLGLVFFSCHGLLYDLNRYSISPSKSLMC